MCLLCMYVSTVRVRVCYRSEINLTLSTGCFIATIYDNGMVRNAEAKFIYFVYAYRGINSAEIIQQVTQVVRRFFLRLVMILSYSHQYRKCRFRRTYLEMSHVLIVDKLTGPLCSHIIMLCGF